MNRLVAARRGRKVERRGLAGDVGVPRAVDRNAARIVEVGAAEIGRIEQRRSGRVQFEDERVVVVGEAARAVRRNRERSVEGAVGGRKVARLGLPDDVGVAGCIDDNAAAPIEVLVAADEG